MFVLDPALLRGPRAGAPIVQFFFESLTALRGALRAQHSDLMLLEGDAGAVLGELALRVRASALFFNVDYEPEAVARDARVAQRLRGTAIDVHASTDHVYFGAGEVLRNDGLPYTVYTPYRRRWEERFASEPHPPVPSARAARAKLLARAAIGETRDVPRPEQYGHRSIEAYPRGGLAEAHRVLDGFLADGLARYAERRNAPALEGTSRLSPHLRAGTIGIRTVVHAASALGDRETAWSGARAWTGELIWRDFYQQLLHHRPQLAHEPFAEAAKSIAYARDDAVLAAWREGRTGYPIVDAAMIQLNATGWMHNRLRMIVASFLTKHLLIDYREGERYFERQLADADLAANNGGWQWAASTGTDAAPYFRIFNPVAQGRTFDPDGAFVKRMIPALAAFPPKYVHAPWTTPPLLQAQLGCVIGRDYPEPLVDHAFARERALAVYGAALGRHPERRPVC